MIWVGDAMSEDCFSKYHPAVNFIFFAGAICMGVIIMHPLYLVATVFGSSIYYILLNRKACCRTMGRLFVLFVFLTIINPLLNTKGETVLFYIFTRAYTLEALFYGAAIAAVFVSMILWFGCCNIVMSSDKIMSLFSNIIPSVSMLIVMVCRMIPHMINKIHQIIAVRKIIGKGIQGKSSLKEKILSGMTVIEVLTSWSLEGSIVTGDSMRARGYGVTKRTGFNIYRMKVADWALVVIMLVLISTVILAICQGWVKVTFVPLQYAVPVKGVNILGLIAYFGYLLIPTLLHIKESVQWNISKYRI